MLLLGAHLGRHIAGSDAVDPTATGIEAWAYAFGGDICGNRIPSLQEINRYDLVIANLNSNLLTGYAHLAESREKHVKWVSLVEGAGEDYFHAIPGLDAVLNVSDLVGTINPLTEPLFRARTQTPVATIGIPYPAEAVRACAEGNLPKIEEALICPRVDRLPSLLAARSAGVKARLYVPKTSRKVANLRKFKAAGGIRSDAEAAILKSKLKGFDVTVHLEKRPREFWREASRCRVWVNLDPRTTWARFVLDAAALGVPIVTTSNTTHGPNLFPDLTVESVLSVSEASEKVRWIWMDESERKRTAEFAWNALQPYTPEPTVARLVALL